MEVASTTNPIPPTGGANPTAPLGISTSFSISMTQEALRQKYIESRSQVTEILIDEFTVSSLLDAPFALYNWSTLQTKLSRYLGANAFMPWNLIKPIYSNMLNMEYVLIFRPYKVADAAVKIQSTISYENTTFSLNVNTFANHNFEFDFNDSSDIFILPVPQYFQHINLTSKRPITSGTVSTAPAFLPTTKIDMRVMNTYAPNNVIPDTFDVQVFLMVIPNNMKNIAAPREIYGGWSDPVLTTPTNYYMT